MPITSCRICSLWKWTTPGRNNTAAVAPAAKDKNRLEGVQREERYNRPVMLAVLLKGRKGQIHFDFPQIPIPKRQGAEERELRVQIPIFVLPLLTQL